MNHQASPDFWACYRALPASVQVLADRAFALEPSVELATNYGLNVTRLNEASKLVEEHLDEIRSAWAKHFPR